MTGRVLGDLFGGLTDVFEGFYKLVGGVQKILRHVLGDCRESS